MYPDHGTITVDGKTIGKNLDFPDKMGADENRALCGMKQDLRTCGIWQKSDIAFKNPM